MEAKRWGQIKEIYDRDRKSTRLNSSHLGISYAVFCFHHLLYSPPFPTRRSSDLERLIPLVDAEMRRLARRYLRHERPGHILQTTALVNEAWLYRELSRGV